MTVDKRHDKFTNLRHRELLILRKLTWVVKTNNTVDVVTVFIDFFKICISTSV